LAGWIVLQQIAV